MCFSPCEHKSDNTVCWICTKIILRSYPRQGIYGNVAGVTDYFLHGERISEDDAQRIKDNAEAQLNGLC